MLLLAVGALLVLGGCSSKGMMTADHNGKKYWNPGNCEQYRYSYSNPDAIRCMHDGSETGQVLYPVDQQQLNNYYREQAAEQKALDGLNNQLNQMNKNMQLQNQNFQLQQLNNNLNGIRYGY